MEHEIQLKNKWLFPITSTQTKIKIVLCLLKLEQQTCWFFCFVSLILGFIETLQRCWKICSLLLRYSAFILFIDHTSHIHRKTKCRAPGSIQESFFVYFRTERMMWKKIDTLFSLGQWTEIKMKLSIFPVQHIFTSLVIVAVFFLFFIFYLYYSFFIFYQLLYGTAFQFRGKQLSSGAYRRGQYTAVYLQVWKQAFAFARNWSKPKLKFIYPLSDRRAAWTESRGAKTALSDAADVMLDDACRRDAPTDNYGFTYFNGKDG